MTLMNIGAYYQKTVKGVIIAVAVIVDVNARAARRH